MIGFASLTIRRKFFQAGGIATREWSRWCLTLFDIGTGRARALFARGTAIGDHRQPDLAGSKYRSFIMRYCSRVLALAALSLAHVTSTAAQPVYVAPGGVYIGGGPVYVTPAPSNGAGTYVEPPYGYEYGLSEQAPHLAPTDVPPGDAFGAAAYGFYGNGYGPPPPAYYYHGYPYDTLSGGRVIGRDPDPFIRGEILRHYTLGYK
jgi:hypothetical protein